MFSSKPVSVAFSRVLNSARKPAVSGYCFLQLPNVAVKIISFANRLIKTNYQKGIMSYRKLLSSFFLILSISILAGCSGENKFEKEIAIEASAIKLAREAFRGNYKLIDTKELKQKIDANTPLLLVDTMPFEESYKKNHIPTAKQFLFPIPEMEAWESSETAGQSKEDFLKLLGEDKTKTIVIYCGFVKCTRSHNGAMWAVKLGYSNVYRYPGGVFAWKGAKYPLNSAN